MKTPTAALLYSAAALAFVGLAQPAAAITPPPGGSGGGAGSGSGTGTGGGNSGNGSGSGLYPGGPGNIGTYCNITIGTGAGGTDNPVPAALLAAAGDSYGNPATAMIDVYVMYVQNTQPQGLQQYAFMNVVKTGTDISVTWPNPPAFGGSVFGWYGSFQSASAPACAYFNQLTSKFPYCSISKNVSC